MASTNKLNKYAGKIKLYIYLYLSYIYVFALKNNFFSWFVLSLKIIVSLIFVPNIYV